MTRPGIEPQFPGLLVNILTIMPMSGNTPKWYMLKLESVLENETQNIEIQTDHLIPARRPDLEIIYK